MITVQDIYNIIDDAAPFASQESYDHSGLLSGSPAMPVRRVLLTLDITIPVIEEASARHAELILSHHPVIWEPLRSISPHDPAWHLARFGIAAICAHTNLDLAPRGINFRLGEMLRKALPFKEESAPLAANVPGGLANLAKPVSPESLAECLQKVFSCRSLRFFAACPEIKRIAWCSGSGGSLLEEVDAAGADALITGDCKHSVWMEAQNRGLSLFDCGHFETELPAVSIFADLLQEALPELEILVSQRGTMPPFSLLS